MSNKPTAEDVLEIAGERDVRFIHLQLTDIFGVTKSVSLPVAQLEPALNGEVMFDGSSIEGFVRINESDMYLKADPSTFAVYPWESQHTPGQGRTARLICDVLKPNGEPFEGDPRYVLRRAIQRAEDMGFVMNAGPEPEFFLFERDEKGNPVLETQDAAGYFDHSPVDLGDEARREIVISLQQMGFDVEASHHEVAPGQHEIDFRYADALTTADNIATFRNVVRYIASKHNVYATFMPKPIAGINGSGMHTHQSLFRNGENAFYDPDADNGLSEIALQYIAGIIKHARGFAAVTNPLVNSYKRLVPGYEAPVYVAWSESNRSPMIRVPAPRKAGTRIEVRNPDPSCNPYLALAVMLQSGLDGIENGLTPPKAVRENVYEMDDAERLRRGIEVLPGSLEQAIEALKDDEYVLEALGDHVVDHYLEAKQIEWDVYRSKVHDWEIEQYLRVY